jgi:O-antigen/teichoic acid export membrane protein
VTPLLTRQYSPEDIGLYQIAMVLAIGTAMLASMRIDTILPSVPDEEMPGLLRMVRFGLGWLIGAGLVMVPLLTVWMPKIANALAMIIILAVVLAFQTVDTAMLIRSQSLAALSRRNATFGITAAGFQVAAGILCPSAWSLAMGVVAGRLLAVLTTRPKVAPHSTAMSQANTGASYGKASAARNVLAGVLASFSTQGLLLAVAAVLGAGAAGQVAIAQRAASAPITLVGQGIAQAVALKASATVRAAAPRLTVQLLRDTKRLLLIAVAASLTLFALGAFGLELVLGPGWDEAATVLMILSVGMLAQLAVSPQTVVFPLIRCERLQLRLEGAKTVTLLGSALLVGWATRSLWWMAVATSVVLFVAYLGTLLLLLRQATKWDDRVRKETRSD